jgi:hypothetical protein
MKLAIADSNEALLCTAEDIHMANQLKEYTLIATQIQQVLFSDERLSAQMVKCWQILFEKARFDEDLSVDMGYQWLADLLCRSKRTAMRCVRGLVDAGYLKVVSHVGEVNTFLVRIPSDLMNRVVVSSNRSSLRLVKLPQSSAGDKNVTPPVTSVSPNNNNNFNKIYPNNNITQVSSIGAVAKSSDVVVVVNHENTDGVERERELLAELDSLSKVREVAVSEFTQSLQELAVVVKTPELEPDVYRAALDKKKMLDNRLSSVEATIGRVQGQLKQLSVSKTENANPNSRIFSKNQRKTLEQALSHLDAEKRERLIGEVQWDIAKGSLRVSKKTKSELTVDAGINIALWLIRQNRWARPFEMPV